MKNPNLYYKCRVCGVIYDYLLHKDDNERILDKIMLDGIATSSTGRLLREIDIHVCKEDKQYGIADIQGAW